jgi:hypothetical protein
MSFDLKMKAILDMGYAMVRSSRRSEDGRRRPSSVEQSSSSGVTRDVLPRQQVDMTQKTLAQVCADVAESLVAGGALDATNQPDVSNMEQMIRTRVSDEHIKQLITNGDILPLAQSAYVAIVYPALISDLNALSKEVVSGFSGASGQGTSSSIVLPKSRLFDGGTQCPVQGQGEFLQTRGYARACCCVLPTSVSWHNEKQRSSHAVVRRAFEADERSTFEFC